MTIFSTLRCRISLAGLAVSIVALLFWGMQRGSLRRAEPPAPAQSARIPSDPIAWQAVLSQGYDPTQHPCAACHAEITAQYASSGMSRSWRAVTRSVASALPTGLFAVVQQADFRYEVWQREGGLWQVETHRDDPYQLTRQAAYLVGSGTHATAMVWEERGYLFQMPLAYFQAGSAWRLSPGYEQRNHRFRRPITAACVSCHRGSAATDHAATNYFAPPVEPGIDCAACHGPTETHVAMHQAAASGQAPLEGTATLVHPGRLAPIEVNSLCLRCHLQGDVAVYRAGCSPGDFMPGQRLGDWRCDLMLAGNAVRSVASHGADMLASRCYRASGGRLTCVSCHDAHRPARAQTAQEYDPRCAACHQRPDCRRAFLARGSGERGASASDQQRRLETSCIGCHMPRRSTREGIHDALTDHTIPRLGRAEGATSSRLQVGEQDALVSAWPDESPSAATLGAAYVLWHETMGPRPEALQQSLAYLQEALRQQPDDRVSHFWLGSALVALGQGAAAQAHLQAALHEPSVRPLALFRLGLAHELAGDRRGAIAVYEQLLREAPRWVEPYDRLADLYLSENLPDRAAEVLQQRLARLPEAAAMATWALALRLQGATHPQAMAHLEEALRLDPREPRVYLVRASLWLLAGQDRLAQADLARALSLQPDHPAAREMIQRLDRKP